MEPRDQGEAGLVGEFVCDGDYWTVAFAGAELRARDSKGMRYLAEMLARPGVEIPALEFAGRSGPSEMGVAEAAQAGLASDAGAGGVPLLDAQAKAAYKSRLEDLRNEIDEAQTFHDPERLARAKAEYAFVTDELSSAVGLGGRDRRTGTPQERARINVTRTIRAAMGHLAAHDDALGEHLAACVHTGRVCVYEPGGAAPVSWTVRTRTPRRRRTRRFQAPETQYARSGEADIAYQVLGDGPFDLLFVPGFVSHLDLQWADPRIAGFLERLASFSRLILFDKRGTGLSDPIAGPAPLEDRMDDVRLVMDAAGCERAALLGLSEGGPMSVLFAATYPERTHALVLCGTYPAGTLDPDDNPSGQRWVDAMRRIRETTEHWGRGDTLAVLAPSAADGVRARIERGVFERSAASPQMARLLIEMNITETDVRDLLPSVQVPTLVLHRENEFLPVEGARYLAERIPGARLVVMPGDDHVPYFGDGERYTDEIEEFLSDALHVPEARSEPERILTTVMFSAVAATPDRAVPGDSRRREIADRHAESARAEVARHRGREISATADGFAAIFDGPARGIRCARAIGESLRALDIQVRAGLHTGECELTGQHVGGIAVDICTRIGALAHADEVLVSSTVRDLVVGSGITFTDHGTRAFDSIPGEWRLLLVRGAEEPASSRLVPDGRERRLSDRAVSAAARKAPGLVQRVLRT